MGSCEKCGKRLPAIGTARKNGKEYASQTGFNADWDDRKYHKKCFKEIKERQYHLWQLAGLMPY